MEIIGAMVDCVAALALGFVLGYRWTLGVWSLIMILAGAEAGCGCRRGEQGLRLVIEPAQAERAAGHIERGDVLADFWIYAP